ncbi:MAG TPA: NAD(P)-dependent oxidoreductase [Verrucomicrobiae bacterium]|nr:NAD(P)-dependent oxidoreductase [Verrucomicrobiae bacterium]
MALPCDVADVDGFLSEPTEGALRSMGGMEGDAIVLGAAGKMGPHLAMMLRRGIRGRVFGVSRFSDGGARERLTAAGVETIACDLGDRDAVARLPEAPNVFFMAGQKFGTSGAPDATWAMNVLVPAIVAERYRGSRIVAFSTGCVYPFVSVGGSGSREDDAVGPPSGEYAWSCVGRERMFAHGARRHGTRVALFRLNYSVEFRYGVLVDIAQKILAGEPVDLTMGHVNIIWQGDAVARAIQSMELAASPPGPINVTGPDTLLVRDLAARLGRRLGREPRFTGAESATAWLSNASRSIALWGAPSVSVDQMIEWVASWLEIGGRTLGKPTHFEARDGKY